MEPQGVPLDRSSPDPRGESLVQESRRVPGPGSPRIQGKSLGPGVRWSPGGFRSPLDGSSPDPRGESLVRESPGVPRKSQGVPDPGEVPLAREFPDSRGSPLVRGSLSLLSRGVPGSPGEQWSPGGFRSPLGSPLALEPKQFPGSGGSPISPGVPGSPGKSFSPGVPWKSQEVPRSPGKSVGPGKSPDPEGSPRIPGRGESPFSPGLPDPRTKGKREGGAGFTPGAPSVTLGQAAGADRHWTAPVASGQLGPCHGRGEGAMCV